VPHDLTHVVSEQIDQIVVENQIVILRGQRQWYGEGWKSLPMGTKLQFNFPVGTKLQLSLPISTKIDITKRSLCTQGRYEDR
jgi:hypothetical protein